MSYSIGPCYNGTRLYQSSVSLAFVRGIHRWPWKMFFFDDIIMYLRHLHTSSHGISYVGWTGFYTRMSRSAVLLWGSLPTLWRLRLWRRRRAHAQDALYCVWPISSQSSFVNSTLSVISMPWCVWSFLWNAFQLITNSSENGIQRHTYHLKFIPGAVYQISIIKPGWPIYTLVNLAMISTDDIMSLV